MFKRKISTYVLNSFAVLLVVLTLLNIFTSEIKTDEKDIPTVINGMISIVGVILGLTGVLLEISLTNRIFQLKTHSGSIAFFYF